MAGLLAGIMLARPAASMLADTFGWRAVFWVSAGLMLVLAGWLAKALPRSRQPQGSRTQRMSYGHTLRSMGHILVRTPALQRRAIY